MSNTTTDNPIICNATGLLVNGSGRIVSIQFTNTGGDGDITIILTDSLIAGGTKKLVQLELTAEQKTITYVPPRPLQYTAGLYCETIDGAEALIQI